MRKLLLAILFVFNLHSYSMADEYKPIAMSELHDFIIKQNMYEGEMGGISFPTARISLARKGFRLEILEHTGEKILILEYSIASIQMMKKFFKLNKTGKNFVMMDMKFGTPNGLTNDIKTKFECFDSNIGYACRVFGFVYSADKKFKVFGVENKGGQTFNLHMKHSKLNTILNQFN